MPRAPVTLLDLSDELLQLILFHVLAPVQVSSHCRVSSRGLARALPVAQTCTRLHSLLFSSLTDLEPWPSGKLPDEGLSFLVRHAGPTVRRFILRGSARLTIASLTDLAVHCTALRTLDLSLVNAVDDDALRVVCTGPVGRTLESLLVRRCARVTDAGLAAVADLCPRLTALDAGGLVNLSDAGVQYLAKVRADTLKILILSWCKQLTDASLLALSHTHVRALFLRGLSITDRGLEALIRGAGDTLITIDLLDCPDLSNSSFSVMLRDGCPGLRDKLVLAESRDLFQNSVSILDGYVHVVAGVNQYGQESTLICIVDAGSANAFAFKVLSGEPISFDSDDVKVLATNSGLAVTDETKQFVRDSFGIDL